MPLLEVDSRKRISLGKLISENTHLFEAHLQPNGDILLRPMRAIPEKEAWLYENQEALNRVRKGLAANKTVDLGSFAKYTED